MLFWFSMAGTPARVLRNEYNIVSMVIIDVYQDVKPYLAKTESN